MAFFGILSFIWNWEWHNLQTCNLSFWWNTVCARIYLEHFLLINYILLSLHARDQSCFQEVYKRCHYRLVLPILRPTENEQDFFMKHLTNVQTKLKDFNTFFTQILDFSRYFRMLFITIASQKFYTHKNNFEFTSYYATRNTVKTDSKYFDNRKFTVSQWQWQIMSCLQLT